MVSYVKKGEHLNKYFKQENEASALEVSIIITKGVFKTWGEASDKFDELYWEYGSVLPGAGGAAETKEVIDQAKTVVTGTDLNGEESNRYVAGGLLILEFAPVVNKYSKGASKAPAVFRALRKLSKVDDAIRGASKLCFAEGTKISTSDGLIAIEDIQIGDSVWAFDETTGDRALKVVYNTLVHQADHLLQLRMGSDTLKTTDDHPFYVNGTWVKAMNLNVGDSLNLLNGGKIVLSEKSRIDTTVTVYNFSVSDYVSYYVGEQQVLVHNTCGVSITEIAQKAYKKLPPSIQQNVDKSINILKSGAAGGNQHALTREYKGLWAIDVKGSGKGRGGLRIIYEKVSDSEILIHEITDYH